MDKIIEMVKENPYAAAYMGIFAFSTAGLGMIGGLVAAGAWLSPVLTAGACGLAVIGYTAFANGARYDSEGRAKARAEGAAEAAGGADTEDAENKQDVTNSLDKNADQQFAAGRDVRDDATRRHAGNGHISDQAALSLLQEEDARQSDRGGQTHGNDQVELEPAQTAARPG